MAANSKERFSFSFVYPKNTAHIVFIPQGRSPPPPAPPFPKYCPNSGSRAGACQQTPPTTIIIVAGMFCMLFLVAIAILLLLYSYYKYRRADSSDTGGREDHTHHTPGAAPQDNIEGEGGLGSSCPLQLPESTQMLALAVIMPGDEEPRFFARPSSLPNVCERASDHHHVTESSSRTGSLEARNDD